MVFRIIGTLHNIGSENFSGLRQHAVNQENLRQAPGQYSPQQPDPCGDCQTAYCPISKMPAAKQSNWEILRLTGSFIYGGNMPVGISKSFLEFHQLSPDVAMSIIDRAGFMANAWADRRMPQSLQGKRVALIVDDSGWRNTTAFDLGVQAMGGICVQAPISFNVRETTADLAGYLDNWFDILIVRTKELSALRALTASAKAAVVNARTKSNHPCETLGDLAYVHSKRGTVDGLKIVGVAADANIFRSWVEASISLPIRVTQVYPERWHVRDPALLNPNFSVSTDMAELLDADVILTDSWPHGAERADLADYQISATVLNNGRPDAIFLPCPPVARGQEVTVDAMTHPVCQSRAAKAFLLHAQNALLEWVVA